MSEKKPYDICGWATKFNVHCADDRTILPGAFDDDDGKKVPLVWQHMIDEPANVLGHAILHVRPEGVWTEAWFNDSERAEDAKELIRNQDIDAFSIYANKLKHKGHEVVHGIIREVSLVVAGANPGALIEFPVLEHGDGEPVEDEAIIYSHGELAPAGALMHGAMGNMPGSLTGSAVRGIQTNVMPANALAHQAEPIRRMMANPNIGERAPIMPVQGNPYMTRPNGAMPVQGNLYMTRPNGAMPVPRPARQMMPNGAMPIQRTPGSNPAAQNASNGGGQLKSNNSGTAKGSAPKNDTLVHSQNGQPAAQVPNAPTVKGGNTMPNAQNQRTVRDVFNEMTDEQKNVVYFMLGEMMDELGQEDDKMMHSAFDKTSTRQTLSADDYKEIFALAKKEGSLRAGVETFLSENASLSHSVYNADGTEQTYGIADIDTLFPEYKNITDTPEFIKRDQDWVGTVMSGVRKTPFSRIKSQFANITMDEARAKGFTKGNPKVEEVFSLLKRTTDPQTVYKKQKMDRDDILDITDFDVVRWIKGEMRLMLDEEVARAILIGDGRLSTDDDKIDPTHIRPIWGDDELYAIKAHVTAGADDAATAKSAIRTAIKARKNYKGSGNLTFYTTEDMLTEMLLLEDGIGHALYPDVAALARKLRVNKIVTVPVMENQTANGETLVGIMVDLKDYNVGADKGGEVNLFDDFDIDYNRYKYMIETRISGALVRPYSAIVLVVGGTPTTYTEAADYTGSPKDKGYYEKEGTIYRPSRDTSIVQGKTYYVKG